MKKILIVDDSPMILKILEDNFKKEYDVLTATTGEDGLEKAKTFSPDIIILDTILPCIDGFGVCSLIKSWQHEIIPKVIIMTGSIDAFDALQARKAGADDYCAKTSNLSEIMLAVKKITEVDFKNDKALQTDAQDNNNENQIDLKKQNRMLKEQLNKIKKELNDQEWATSETNEGIKLLYKELESKNIELKKLSRTDALTQLYNRRVFYEYLEIECARCNRYKRPMSLLYIDVDDFKSYNDQYGHEAGDSVLVEMANIFKNNLRKNDFAFRVGGEEFTILLLETNMNSAIIPAERIRKQIENLKFYPQPEVNSELCVHKTVSIGIAEYKIGQKSSEFVKESDQAMYKAKTTGKNRIWFKMLIGPGGS